MNFSDHEWAVIKPMLPNKYGVPRAFIKLEYESTPGGFHGTKVDAIEPTAGSQKVAV